MKNIIINLLFGVVAFVPVSLIAQMGQPYEMIVNGVKVIVQPSNNDIVVVQTVIKGGVQNYKASNAGIESLAITGLSECGTVQDDKNSFKNKLDKVSARVSGSSGMDYSNFNLNCIKSDFETVWPLYAAALSTPLFDKREFERVKQDAINTIRANESNPDAAIDNMSRQNAFAGKKYAIDPAGTVASVTTLTAEVVKQYWKTLLKRSRMVIIIVGDLDKEMVRTKVSALTSQIEQGLPFRSVKESYAPVANTFKPMMRDNATNYVQGITAGPQPGTPEFNAFVLAMRIFSNRHFIEIRSKNGLSYAPGAWFSAGTTSYANIYVTTTEPDKYIAVARQLIDEVKKNGFTAEELKNEKTGYLTGIYYRQETNEAQANSLASNEVIHGNWRRSSTINDDMKKVSVADINNAFKKYITNITWSYQGDPKKVNPALYTQKTTPALPTEKKGF